jgi:uridine kinase
VSEPRESTPREQLLVTLAGRILALPEDAPLTVAVDGMSGAGKTTLAAEVAAVLTGAGRQVVAVPYDGFHQPRERRHRQGRLSPEGYLEDSFDAAALRSHVLDPVARGEAVRPAAYDLAADEPVEVEPVRVGPGTVVLVEGSFVLAPEVAAEWDLAVLVVADPAVVLERVLVRDADLGTPEQVRELYVRRYFGAWSLHEERNDPWSRADVVVDLSDPEQPRLLG